MELQKRGTLFFNGQTLPGMLDYMIWPWMERLEVPSAIHADLNNILGVPTSDFALMVNSIQFTFISHFFCPTLHTIQIKSNSLLFLDYIFKYTTILCGP